MKKCLNYTSYATRPLLQCFLHSNLDKNTAGADKEPSHTEQIKPRCPACDGGGLNIAEFWMKTFTEQV